MGSDSNAQISIEELENLDEVFAELFNLMEIENTKVAVIQDSVRFCSDLLLFLNILVAILIGVVCASIFSRFLSVKK